MTSKKSNELHYKLRQSKQAILFCKIHSRWLSRRSKMQYAYMKKEQSSLIMHNTYPVHFIVHKVDHAELHYEFREMKILDRYNYM
jgi:hypothetical protein